MKVEKGWRIMHMIIQNLACWSIRLLPYNISMLYMLLQIHRVSEKGALGSIIIIKSFPLLGHFYVPGTGLIVTWVSNQLCELSIIIWCSYRVETIITSTWQMESWGLKKFSNFPKSILKTVDILFMNWTHVHLPDSQQSRCTDMGLWWKKVQRLLQGTNQGEWAANAQKILTPWWFSGKGF